MKRKIVPMAALLGVCLAILPPVKGHAGPPPGYRLTVSAHQAAVGQEITVTVTGQNLESLYGYDLDLHYDAERLEYVGMSSGLTGGYAVAPSAGSDRELDRRAKEGDILFGYTATGGNPGFSGELVLGTIRFIGKAKGEASVSLEQVKLIPVDSKADAQVFEPHAEVHTVIKASGGGSPGGGSGGGDPGTAPGQTTAPQQGANIVKEFTEQEGQAVVMLSSGQSAALPLDKLAGKELKVQLQETTLKVAPELIRSMSGQAGDTNGAELVVELAPVTSGDGVPAGGRSAGGAHLRAAGQTWEIRLSVRTAEGVTTPAGNVSGGLELSFGYDPSKVDGSLLGVYYLNEASGEWEYAGGSVDPVSNRVTVKLQHLSKYALFEYDKTFADVPAGHWVYPALKSLSARHIVQGVTEERFQPDSGTTRAEFAALLVRALGLKAAAADPGFTDVRSGDWFAADVAAAYSAGLIQGVSEAEFAPDSAMTREQMAVLLVRAYEYAGGKAAVPDEGLQAYADRDTVSDWARDGVGESIALGLMTGKSKDVFDPASEVTRAEMAQALYNLLHTGRSGEGEAH